VVVEDGDRHASVGREAERVQRAAQHDAWLSRRPEANIDCVRTDDRGTLHVVQAQLPPGGVGVESADFSEPRGELAWRRVPDAPDRGEVLLGVEGQAAVVDLTVEVHGELRNPGDRLATLTNDVDPSATDHPAGDAEVAVEPAVVEDAAVHLDTELLPSESAGVGTRLDPQTR
jgi:hypothetical protein